MENMKVKTEPCVSLLTIKKERAKTNKCETGIEHVSGEAVRSSTLHQSFKEEPCCLSEHNAQIKLLNIINDETNTVLKEEVLYIKNGNEELNATLVKELKREDMKYSVDITEHKTECSVNIEKQPFTNVHEEDIKPVTSKDEVESDCIPGKQVSKIPVLFIKKINILSTNNITENESEQIENCFKCSDCGKNFSQKGHLKIHLNSVHKGNKKFNRCSKLACHNSASQENTSRKLCCDDCHKKFTTKSHLIRHLREVHHHVIDSIVHNVTCFEKCPVCNRSLSTKKTLKAHLNSMHKGIKHINCNKCNRIVSCLEYLKVHLKVNSCNKIPLQNSSSKEKIMREYKDIAYICAECGKEFIQSKRLINHMNNIHKSEKRSVCGECEKCFPHVETLKMHINNVHRELGKCECKICGKIYFNKWSLKYHCDSAHTVRKYECEICFKIYFHRASLRYHINSSHSVRKYDCKICFKIYFYKHALRYHIKAAHTSDNNIAERARSCICEVYGKTSSTLRTLKTHFDLMHKQDKIVYICDICGQTFTTKINLRNHVATIHDQIISFYCAECGKGFSLKGTLKNHINICHRNIKNYACVVCRKKFKAAEELRYHVSSTHTGVKNFKCSECGELFYTDYSLKSHFNNVHSIKNETCSVCNKTFAKVSSLCKHVQIMHTDIKNYKFTD